MAERRAGANDGARNAGRPGREATFFSTSKGDRTGGPASSATGRAPVAALVGDAGTGDASDAGGCICVVSESSGAHEPRYGAVNISAAVATPVPPALRFIRAFAAASVRRPVLSVPFTMLHMRPCIA
ncbi:hypothetical protein [Burkholderia ubonensis]|uniref:hypothetical protein n=1 Tax=Burkholderia ubonensis TaxID=101571 RepID=UPI0012FA4A2C|nr:hypothetical protein [Burkholderia ubonensis]